MQVSPSFGPLANTESDIIDKFYDAKGDRTVSVKSKKREKTGKSKKSMLFLRLFK